MVLHMPRVPKSNLCQPCVNPVSHVSTLFRIESNLWRPPVTDSGGDAAILLFSPVLLGMSAEKEKEKKKGKQKREPIYQPKSLSIQAILKPVPTGSGEFTPDKPIKKGERRNKTSGLEGHDGGTVDEAGTSNPSGMRGCQKDELPKLIEKLIDEFFAQKQAEREKWEEEQIAKGQLKRLGAKDIKEAGGKKV